MLYTLFPDWTQEDMDIQYFAEIATFVVKGYAVVPYLTREGRKTKKVWAVGAAVVHKKKDELMPSQPDDSAKAAYTEWIKLVARRLGIGNDVYEQSVTSYQKDMYTKKAKLYEHTDILDKRANAVQKKDDFDSFLKSLPTDNQIVEFTELVNSKYIGESQRNQLWSKFQQGTSSTVKVIIDQLKSYIKNKEQQNGESKPEQ